MALVHKWCTPLYQIFLNFSKAYPLLHRKRILKILADYGVGPNTIRLLRNFWDKETIIAYQAGFFGEPFTLERGVTQGDPIS